MGSVAQVAERPSFSRIYMGLALALSRRSSCSRAQVGCVVTTFDGTQVLAIGYNGGPRGLPDTCGDGVAPGLCPCTHGEANAMVKLPYDHPSLKRLYTTTEPCRACAALIVNAGISEVVYLHEYRLHDGLELLKLAGLKVRKMELSDLSGDLAETAT